MPADGKTIGRLVEAELGSFLWQIPGFSGLPKKEGIRFCSPFIHLAGTLWILWIYPNGKDFSYRTLLMLQRLDGGPAKTIHCIVGVRRADGEEEEVCRQTAKFGHGYTPWALFPFCTRAEKGKFLSYDTLTLTLRITEGEAASQGGLLNSQSTQTESSNFRCERQNDSTEEEGSSSEAKDGTFRGTEREGLEFTADNVNEDRKDDCTSPEARGFMLLTKHMRELLGKKDDCDVRFRVQEKEFTAHRNIVKARCPVFRMVLTHDTEENKSGVIRIEDCDADAFEVFLMYVYSGKVEDLTPQKAINLYYIAEKYDFSELKEQCVALLKGSLSKTTVCDVILLSAKHGEPELMEAATNFFVQNIKEILVTVEWQNFLSDHPTEGNELYIKSLNILFENNGSASCDSK